jgi:stringent starvation protein B
MNAPDATSTRPYLIRALHEWCTDNGFTPYIAVLVDEAVQVPREYVKNNEIVLNIGFDATSSLTLGNEFIEFKARFAGSGREIMVPVTHVIAIYARENGQGMSFPMMLPAAGSSKGVDAGSTTPLVSGAGNAATDAPEAKIMQLVPESAASSDAEGPDLPEPPTSPPRTRPALTRVK